MEELAYNNFEKIGGNNIEFMGKSVGKGLSSKSSKELGLKEGTPVAVGIIDAHAGGLGLVKENKIFGLT